MSRAIPETLEMIGALIERPSISCTDSRYDQSNLPVINLLAEWLDGLGFSVEVRDVGNRKANLIASLGSRDDPSGLVLSGHTDTVPCDPDLWSSDPFKAVQRDGRIYGLGSADMKSFFALALEAASHLDGKKLKHPLMILATADEESSMAGVKSLVADHAKLGRYAVIGEPTGLRPIRMHKGIMLESIVVKGKSGHSSDPSLGANAIEGMHAVLSELLAFRDELKAQHRNPAFRMDYPTLNLGSIHGGDNPNRICGHCETQIDIRPLPGMALEELHDRLVQRLEPVLARVQGLSLDVRRVFEGVPPFESAADGEIVRCCEALSGCSSGAVAFGTEAPFLKQLGLQTVVMGPGHIEQAHQPDEYLPLEHIRSGTGILSRLIERFCIRPAT